MHACEFECLLVPQNGDHGNKWGIILSLPVSSFAKEKSLDNNRTPCGGSSWNMEKIHLLYGVKVTEKQASRRVRSSAAGQMDTTNAGDGSKPSD